MTIENDLDNIINTVVNLKTGVVLSKTKLDQAVKESADNITISEHFRDQTQSFRDQAEALTTISGATDGIGVESYADLKRIAETKTDNAVDVFVYDTSLDSDGGAWRYRTKGTSWYNETLNTATRGSRREFPAVAVLVVEADKITIYDGDDPDLPMWMIANKFASTWDWISYDNTSSATCCNMLNGCLVLGSKGSKNTRCHLLRADFVKDFVFNYKSGGNIHLGTITQRDESHTDYNAGDKTLITHEINDVAMTVLPNAPIDPETNLPVPTIAVATDDGVSVIKDDETVVDVVFFYSRTLSIDFYKGGILFNGRRGTLTSGYYCFLPFIPDNNLNHPISGLETYSTDAAPALNTIGSRKTGDAISIGDIFVVGDNTNTTPGGLSFVYRNPIEKEEGMVTHSTKDYNTGWMLGDIKGAFLCDTNTLDLVGSGELVTNGNFDTGDLTGWFLNDPENSTASVNSLGQVEVTNTVQQANLNQIIPVIKGLDYLFEGDFVEKNGGGRLMAYDALTTALNSRYFYEFGGFLNTTIKARTNEFVIRLGEPSAGGSLNIYDNFSLKCIDSDRSVNSSHLFVNGTISRDPVAPGAELVAYSGWSENNYLEATNDIYNDGLYAIGWQKTDNRWEFVHGVVNTSPIDGVTITGTTLKIAGTKPKALIRITATTPSSEQLAKICEDEKYLFQENAKCTLYGDSDEVNALAYDKQTNLLHVGTSDGRSVFDGLIRVDNTTTPVTTAISAVNGFIVEN